MTSACVPRTCCATFRPARLQRFKLPRLTLLHAAAQAPELVVDLIGPGGNRRISAVVDSGADRTLIPKGLAEILGVAAELVEDEDGAKAIGAAFPIWSSRVPLRARVIIPGCR